MQKFHPAARADEGESKSEAPSSCATGAAPRGEGSSV